MAAARFSDYDIGYAMGLIVGEGGFTGNRDAPCFSMTLKYDNRKPLEHLQRMFGGRIYGPYEWHGRRFLSYRLRGRELKEALPLLQRHLPASEKTRRFRPWMKKWQSYFDTTQYRR